MGIFCCLMDLTEPSIDGCFLELVFLFAVAKLVLAGLRGACAVAGCLRGGEGACGVEMKIL